uniref:Uncharacterized protein n=1 Tax=Cacopsylla melanoneura TaxID=428564 RepID=A0A8D8M8Y4_9HEMI
MEAVFDRYFFSHGAVSNGERVSHTPRVYLLMSRIELMLSIYKCQVCPFLLAYSLTNLLYLVSLAGRQLKLRNFSSSRKKESQLLFFPSEMLLSFSFILNKILLSYVSFTFLAIDFHPFWARLSRLGHIISASINFYEILQKR